MAVAVPQLAAYLGIESRDSSQTEELQRLIEAAMAIVETQAPTAPTAIKDLFIQRWAAYQHDQPLAARGQSFANALVNSGAGSIIAGWVVRRLAGATAVVAEPDLPDPGPPIRLLWWSEDALIDASDLGAEGVISSGENVILIPQFPADDAYLWAATWLSDLPDSVGASAGPLARVDDVSWDGIDWAVFRSNQLIETRLADFGLGITFTYGPGE